MSSREKDQADFDLESFIDLFDTAMSSDNPAVQRALKNLLLVSTLVNSDNDNNIRQGPLRRLVDDIHNLNRRLNDLESKQNWAPPAYPFTPGNPSPNIPLSPYVAPGTSPIPNQPWWGVGPGPIYTTGTANTGSTAISSTTYDDRYEELLNKLETK